MGDGSASFLEEKYDQDGRFFDTEEAPILANTEAGVLGA